jgi:tetratricopeptide (TPR) repeat protein
MLGRALSKPGAGAEALGFARAALVLQPDNPAAYLLINDALGNLGTGHSMHADDQRDENEWAVGKALELNPDYGHIYNHQGGDLRTQKKPAEAEAAYRKAIRLNPDVGGFYNNLGAVLFDQGKRADAEAAFRKSIELAPEGGLQYHGLSCVLYPERLLEAEAAARKAIELEPEYANAYAMPAVAPQGDWFSTEVADGQSKFVLAPGVDQLIIQTRHSRTSWPFKGMRPLR